MQLGSRYKLKRLQGVGVDLVKKAIIGQDKQIPCPGTMACLGCSGRFGPRARQVPLDDNGIVGLYGVKEAHELGEYADARVCSLAKRDAGSPTSALDIVNESFCLKTRGIADGCSIPIARDTRWDDVELVHMCKTVEPVGDTVRAATVSVDGVLARTSAVERSSRP
jgi:hypothetical protein